MSTQPKLSDRDGHRGPGLLVVQIDGLSRPLLERFLAAGRMPVLGGLLRRRELTLGSWEPLLPPCTPASQAGILHGRNEGIPGFRWFEKGTGQLLVANRPSDATEIASRISDGKGLLAVDGVSIGNLLTGDAVSSHLTLATIEGDPSGHDRSRRGGSYPLNPLVYLRIAGLMLLGLGREAVAAILDRGRSRDVAPRGWRYVLDRVVSTIPLRILSTALVIHEMRRARNVIYVDFTGHDELAHTRGPLDSEARTAAGSIDQSIGTILREAKHAGRPYRLVVLSDHGQSWGKTFSQRFGVPLEAFIASLMGGRSSYHGATLPVEYQDSAVRLAGHGLSGLGRRLAAVFEGRRAYGGRTGHAGDGVGLASTDPAAPGGGSAPAAPDAPGDADVVVAASGNLALVSFPRIPGALTREQLDDRYPGLIVGLAKHPGIGLVLTRSARGVVAIGAAGTDYLDEGRIEGEDPTAAYGPHAAESLRRLAGFETTGDLVILGRLDPATDEVVSFEELVGTHGGLGGWQAEPFIAYPSDWRLSEGPLVGAPALYRQLRAWMGELGLRQS